jgi:uracil-DNA glycosylase family 4
MHVRGVGPCPCDICFVGEGPGWQEDKVGKPFVGKTGDEIDRYCNGVDLPTRTHIFLTNIYRDYMGKDYIYTSDDLARYEPELLKELAKVKPKVIVTLGRHATRYFLGDVDMDATQGLPFYLPNPMRALFAAKGLMLDREVVIFPVIHPAAGMHNPEMSPYVVSGFKALAAYLDGAVDPRILFDDPIKEPVYEEITSAKALDAVLKEYQSAYVSEPLSIDTEGWPGNPWSLQFSYRPGNGYLIRKVRPELLARFIAFVRRVSPRLLFHSALHDLGMGRALGTDFEGLAFDDTMVMAYLLQIEPQGLKPGCLRHCNMKMQDYMDVVGDIGNELARDYLVWLLDSEVADYEEAQHTAFEKVNATPLLDKAGQPKRNKAGGVRYRKISKLPTLPKTPLHKSVVRVLQSKRPRSLWLDQVEDIQVAGYRRLGPLPEPTLDYVSPAIAIPYGCRDSDGTGRLRPEYARRLDAMGLREVYQLELDTYPILDRMQRVGIKPDLDHFAELSGLLQFEIEKLQQSLAQATGRDQFNANSGDQVAEYIFGKLGLESLKDTSSGRGSTNDKVLEALEHEHPEYPVLSTIRSYRETYKLKNTFVDRLPDFVHRWPFDGRVHTTLRTTRVVTGRLAASDPNLLAQPEHGKFATYFKQGWVCEPGHLLCQWDESQVELRGLAHLSQDPIMLAVFRGESRNPDGSLIDLHAALAERIFGVKPKDQDKHRHRLPAKAINFGIPMGMTNRGLSVELRKNGVDADEDTAQRWLDETLNLYKGVKRFMDERIAEARRNGFIRCLSGRIRYIGGIRSRDERVREEAERFAFSTPIQESATFIMKQAEKIVYEDILVPYWKDGKWVEPLLQVHDCLKLECQEGLQGELNVLMTEAMTQVPKGFSVPLAVEGEYGLTMADMVPFE